MLLNLEKLFAEEKGNLPFSEMIDLSKVEYNRCHPFSSPVTVKGTIVGKSGYLQLTGKIFYHFSALCDRCEEPIEKDIEMPFSHILVRSVSNEEGSDEYIVAENDALDLTALAEEDLLLSLPTKFLCKEDCRGLCQTCGKNLNQGPCGCKSHQIDPRLEVLKKLIN